MSQISIPVLSLFCGCGAMDLGFRRQGFVPVLAIDISQSAVASYNFNRKRRIAQCSDLSSTTGEDIIKLVRKRLPATRLRGIIGGPPCQSFSVSNVHEKDNDPQKELPLRYGEILSALNKEFDLDFFVFENVVGLKSQKHQDDLDSFLRSFEEAGFNVFDGELNASAFGVPQNRKRMFVVGFNKKRPCDLSPSVCPGNQTEHASRYSFSNFQHRPLSLTSRLVS
jgi:DNA (cytosine-5)-methyltransferase 1